MEAKEISYLQLTDYRKSQTSLHSSNGDETNFISTEVRRMCQKEIFEYQESMAIQLRQIIKTLDFLRIIL